VKSCITNLHAYAFFLTLPNAAENNQSTGHRNHHGRYAKSTDKKIMQCSSNEMTRNIGSSPRAAASAVQYFGHCGQLGFRSCVVI
jgi:hypothetical protein